MNLTLNELDIREAISLWCRERGILISDSIDMTWNRNLDRLAIVIKDVTLPVKDGPYR